jgi:hypothetical protein
VVLLQNLQVVELFYSTLKDIKQKAQIVTVF